MTGQVTVRPATPADAAAMAEVIVTSWRETYRGLMRDDVLDDPEAIPRRERFWTAALTDHEYGRNRIAVAEIGGRVVGVAMSGPPMDADPVAPWQLYVLYVLAAHHGSGVGSDLLAAVTDHQQPTSLWVADPNPRAQAFYRKSGFAADGAVQVDDGVREIRMLRETKRGPTPANRSNGLSRR